MSDQCGQIVRSLAGHDAGDLFCVVGGEGEYLLLANGKQRKAASPKRKKCRHTETVGALSLKGELTDGRLRAALAVFRKQGGK